MARIRTIKPDMGESRDMARLTLPARYFFALLLCHLDDDGRAEWMPRKLVGAMYPHDEDVDPKMLRGWLDECIATDLLRMYTVDGIDYIYSPTFKKHQTINKKTESRCPTPPIKEKEANTTEALREDYGSTTALEVGKGKGEKERELGIRKEEEEKGLLREKDTSRPALAVVDGNDPPPGKFRKPTVEQIRDLMRDRGWHFVHFESESEKFFAYYDSNGWKVGRNPMRSWESAVTNWGSRMLDRGFDPKKPPTGYSVKSPFELAQEAFSG